MDETWKYGDGFATLTPNLPQPELISTIGAVAEGGDVLAPSPLSCVLENIPREQIKPVETRALTITIAFKLRGLVE